MRESVTNERETGSKNRGEQSFPEVRRVVNRTCFVLAFVVVSSLFGMGSEAGSPAEPVQVKIFEDLPKGSELSPGDIRPSASYREPAFGFFVIPTKYSEHAVALDRSTPFVLRASYEASLPASQHQFRLRARGQAWFLIDDKVLLETKPQKPNTSGSDPVPPPVVRDESGRRPVPYPHQDDVTTIELDGAPHRFTLVAVIGGKGLMPTPGELSVSFGPPGEVERLLGDGETPRLTDAGWETYVADARARHGAADMVRRRARSAGVKEAWEGRHQQVRDWVMRQPAPEVPKVSPATPVLNDIDRFVGARLEAAKTQPLPLTSDLEFFRRLSLDSTGLIPTPEEIRAFLADSPSVRRKQAIERKLADPSWADHWVSYWQDVLAENPGILKPDLNNTGPFRWWLHQSFTDEIPFDRLVTELVEMEGSVHQGAPAGFGQATLNDAPMAAKADIIFQAFQGEKLSCARCHNAPFHPYKQKDLFSLAAMLEGKSLELPATSTVPVVEGRRKPLVQVTLRPGDVLEPEWPFQTSTTTAHLAAVADLPRFTTVPTRHLFATRIVAPENERFAQVIANRVWKRYMGEGLVEPPEDWSQAKPSHPKLLRYLAREFLLSGYDLKHLARMIFSSHAYQRRPDPAASGPTLPDARLFRGPARRRLSAEQLVDSLHQAVGKSIMSEELNLNSAGDRPPRQFLNLGKPRRAWEFTALMNERDRPALALPMAQSAVDVLTTFGWRQSRQSPLTARDDAPRAMQTLILANGILGTRIVRLSDDSAITELCLQDLSLEELLEETFLHVLSRPPSEDEIRMFREYLGPVHAERKVAGAEKRSTQIEADHRVSWSNHLSAEATLIRMEQERRLRMGDAPTGRLKPDFRERFEDVLWALINSPEFVLIP